MRACSHTEPRSGSRACGEEGQGFQGCGLDGTIGASCPALACQPVSRVPVNPRGLTQNQLAMTMAAKSV